jgi:hypothetical protein
VILITKKLIFLTKPKIDEKNQEKSANLFFGKHVWDMFRVNSTSCGDN